MEIPYTANRQPEANVIDNIYNSPKRKVGEAPLWAKPPSTLLQQEPSVVATPVEVKKCSWGFFRGSRTCAGAAR